MAGHCRVMLIEVTQKLTNGVKLRPYVAAEAILSDLTDGMTPEMAELARAEFETLPRSFLPSLALAQQEAVDAGVPFSIESRNPEQVMDTARNGRVTWSVEADEAGVRMYVEHVHGRHAAWMTKAPELAAT